MRFSSALGHNLSHSSCQFWTDESIPLQISNHTSFSWHNSPVNFKLIHFLLWIKGSHQSPNFYTFERALVKFANFLLLFLKAQVSFPSNFASIFSAIKHNTSVFFLAQTLYALVKSSPLKCKFWRVSSAWAKICQIPHVDFELTSQFLFKFQIILHFHDTTPL